ncbi:MAG: TrmH family RNA methyltransferase [Phycisphaerales bacterium JB040]
MPELIHITDPADQRVDAYRNQRDAWLRARHNPDAIREDGRDQGVGFDGGGFMVEGSLVLRQLVASRYRARSLLVLEHRLEAIENELALLPGQTPLYVVDRDTMDAICGFNVHRGVLCAAERGPPLCTRDVLARARTLVVLEDLTNHDNVGGIFRSLAALGGPDESGVLLSPRCCDPLYRKSIRVSMGWALRVPFAFAEDWPGTLDTLAERAWTTVALTPGEQAQDLRELGPIERPALLIGAEGPGLSDTALARAAVRARIPIDPGVDSLNAMVAAAIALHALKR